jgi:hypothetical protein
MDRIRFPAKLFYLPESIPPKQDDHIHYVQRKKFTPDESYYPTIEKNAVIMPHIQERLPIQYDIFRKSPL